VLTEKIELGTVRDDFEVEPASGHCSASDGHGHHGQSELLAAPWLTAVQCLKIPSPSGFKLPNTGT